jgi:signal transduction histidine kinase
MVFSRLLRWASAITLLVLALIGTLSALKHIDQEQAKLYTPKALTIFTSSDAGEQSTTIRSLPYLFQNKASELRAHRVTFEFISAVGDRPTANLALFSPQIIHGGDFYINGHWFFGIPASSPIIRHTWYSPLLAPIPQDLLLSNQTNRIEIHFHSYQRGFVVPTLYIGSLNIVHALYSKYMFISNTLAQASNIFCWIVGAFMLSLWLTSRSGSLFAYSGGATILWATLFTLALTPELDLAFWQQWRFLLYISTGGLVLLMSLFLIEYAEVRLSRHVRRLMILSTLGIPMLFLIWGAQIEYWLDIYWTGLVIFLYVISIFILLSRNYRHMDAITWVLLGYSIIATLCAFHDYGVQAGPLIENHGALLELGVPSLLIEPIFLTHFTLPVVLIIVGAILLRVHASNILAIENANETLEVELIKRERELEHAHAEQRIVIADNAMTEERNRILQDIHDGLGSRLVNLLLQARTGQITIKNLPIDLQACLEDLRLIVSGQFLGDVSFKDALEEFCKRAVHSLRGVGVLLTYDIAHFDSEELSPQTTIHTLRIIQEMLTNTIKHSHATECKILVTDTGRELKICVQDNGVGFDVGTDAFPMKRGMLGIHKRIKELNAESKLTSDASGTRLDLIIKTNKS